jgi:hypothetical protein
MPLRWNYIMTNFTGKLTGENVYFSNFLTNGIYRCPNTLIFFSYFTAVKCSLLQNPTNGYLISHSRQYRSIVKYYCDYGYQLNGSAQRFCQRNGTWTGNEPVCEGKITTQDWVAPSLYPTMW